MAKKIAGKKRKDITLEIYGDAYQELKKSNPSPSVVRSTNIKVVVADPKWQEIRHNLVGTWKKTPDENVEILKKWFGDGKDPLKVRQVLNYITGSGFRIGIISNEKLDKFREHVREVWADMNNIQRESFENYYYSDK